MHKIRQHIAKELFWMVVSFTSYTFCYLDETSSGSECQSDASDFDGFEQTKVQAPRAKASSTESKVQDDAAVHKTWNTLIHKSWVTYLVESCKTFPKLTFSGAPEANFEAHVRANLSTENHAKEWMIWTPFTMRDERKNALQFVIKNLEGYTECWKVHGCRCM